MLQEVSGAAISIIAAIQVKDRGIGNRGNLLVRIKEDLKRFKELTMGHPVIMGRNTFLSIGWPLPGRINIVLSKDPGDRWEGCLTCSSLEDAFRLAAEHDPNEIFVIGGGDVYRQALPYADTLYLTLVESEKPADTFFPEYKEFSIRTLVGKGEQNGLAYSFWKLMKPVIGA
jgi:dihydrofolate reductase